MDSQRPIGRTEFADLGAAIWGAHWPTRAAEACGVTRRSIHNYITGDRPVPAWAPARLERAAQAILDRVTLARDRLREIQGLDPVGEDAEAVDFGDVGDLV